MKRTFDKNTKITIFLHSFYLGGAERQALNLITYLATHQYTVNVLTIDENGPVKDILKKLNVSYFVLPIDIFYIEKYKKLSITSRSSVLFYVHFKKQLRSVFKLIETIKPDIILPYTFIPNVISGLIIKKYKNILSFWNQRDLGVEGGDFNYCETQALKTHQHFISNSIAGKNYLVDFYKVNPNKVTIIHNGIRLTPAVKDRTDWRKKLNVQADTLVVTMLANFHRNKNQLEVVEIWNQLLTKHALQNAVLVLAGRFDGHEKQVMQKVNDLGLNSNVILKESVSDVTGLLLASDLFVFMSKSEGSPNAVLEAMASSLPIVASAIPAISEALGNDYPYLYASENTNAWVNALAELAHSKEKRETIGKKNKEQVLNLFSEQKMCSSYIELFNQHY